MSVTKKLATHAARYAELTLGVVFLAGAVLKALDIDLFTMQIRSYGLFDDPLWLARAALGTLTAETALGTAFVLGLRLRGWTCAAVTALLVVFTGLIAYGWAFHHLEDCGCFGPIEISPGISIGKNAALLFLTAVAWLGLRKQETAASLRKSVGLVQTCVCVGLAGALVLYGYLHIEPVVEPTEENRPFAQFAFDIDKTAFDLGTGEYLVVMLNTTCEHCMESVESLNKLVSLPDFPPIVGLCFEEEPGMLEEFCEITAPLFPIYSLGDRIRTFFSLVGEAPPRFIYVRNGIQIAYWDEKAPDPNLVFLARTAAKRPVR